MVCVFDWVCTTSWRSDRYVSPMMRCRKDRAALHCVPACEKVGRYLTSPGMEQCKGSVSSTTPGARQGREVPVLLLALWSVSLCVSVNILTLQSHWHYSSWRSGHYGNAAALVMRRPNKTKKRRMRTRKKNKKTQSLFTKDSAVCYVTNSISK